MSTQQVTQSSELMENYLQADFLEPQKSFIALQTDAGASLLFSIGTDDVFYLVEERQATRHGWSRVDLSSQQARADFPAGATCTTFAAAQQPATATKPAEIHLAMVLNDGTDDWLYLSLGNSDSDLAWSDAPVWVQAPFNARDAAGQPVSPPQPFEICGVFISEATDGEYVVVDTLRNPHVAQPMLTRYYVDGAESLSPAWMPHDLAIDVEAKAYNSSLGRNDHSYGIDGIYTAGTVDGSAQLVYTPLYNAFDPSAPPTPARLFLDGGATVEAFATVRNRDNTTDAYAISGEGLYYFASSNQHDKAEGSLLLSHSMLSGTRRLFAASEGDRMTVWGLNGSDQVFYLTCLRSQVGNGDGWSLPMPILTGVDAISPYLDRRYSANTFFAHAAGTLIKAVKTPGTGLWRRSTIPLPPVDLMADATRISSYTTRIQVSGNTGQGVAGVPVTLLAADLTSVYINHLYYRIGPDPIIVSTDALGSITIVEVAHTLTATRFIASIDTHDIAINPMDAPFRRNAGYDDVDKLRSAVITDRGGSTRPFIPAGTSDADLRAVAQSNQALAKAYAQQDVNRPCSEALAVHSLQGGIFTDLGDLFNWLESGVEAAVSLIEDVAGDVWHFVARIADDVYYGVLDCVEKIVAAALWVYNTIKVIIEDIILFLEFLFGWQDVITTHRVFRNVLTRFAQSTIDDIGEVKTALPGIFATLRSEIDTWADIPDFGQTPAGSAAAHPPLAGQDGAPAHLGIHHFQNNVASGSSSYVPVGPTASVLQDLLDLIQAEDATLLAAIGALQSDVIDNFTELSVTEIIDRTLAILADTVLQTADNILQAVLDVLVQLTEGLMEVLTARIDIPVLSWLYHELTGDDLTLIDLFCLIAAIPATLLFKVAQDSAPFPRGDAFTEGLIDALDFDQVRAQFVVSPELSVTPGTLSAVLDQHKLKMFAFSTGVLSFVGSITLIIVGVAQEDEDDEDQAVHAVQAPSKRLLATAAAASNVLYVSPNISGFLNSAEAPWWAQLNNVLTGISVVKGIALIGTTESSQTVKVGFAVVETVLNVIWNVPVIANIIENKDVYDTTYKSLIPESIGNFAFNVGGVLEWPKVASKNPTVTLAQAVFMASYGVSSVVAGSIYAWAPDQHH